MCGVCHNESLHSLPTWLIMLNCIFDNTHASLLLPSSSGFPWILLFLFTAVQMGFLPLCALLETYHPHNNKLDGIYICKIKYMGVPSKSNLTLFQCAGVFPPFLWFPWFHGFQSSWHWHVYWYENVRHFSALSLQSKPLLLSPKK